eukprot:gene5785-11686_t
MIFTDETDRLLAHDICGHMPPQNMPNKPPECLKTETNIAHRDGDTYIVTFPKTGTTLIQFVCHLLRTGADERATSFDDIHQVCPHTSSAWYIQQDLNAEQIAHPRLFKSHRMLQQIVPHQKNVKYIATIRDPWKTLVSCYEHRRTQGRLSPPGVKPPSLLEFSFSPTWLRALNEGSVETIWDHFLTFWKCRNAKNFLLLPFEDFVENKSQWLPIIANFMNVPCSTELIGEIIHLTSLESMLELVNKFDESWVVKMSQEIGRAHPTINSAAAKVTNGHGQMNIEVSEEDKEAITELHNKMWIEKIESKVGISCYDDMRKELRELYFPRP